MSWHHFSRSLLAALFGAVLAALPAQAGVLRWANDGDATMLDPYSRSDTFLLAFLGNMYEPLVGRDRDLKLIPMLATEWSQPSPTVWRFKLRAGVTFHDGSPFSADDVAFSYRRVLSLTSNLSGNFASVVDARVIDPLTIEFVTRIPNPIFPDTITGWMVMSRSWSERNNAQVPADLAHGQENFANRHENGTGPFVLSLREPDVKTVMTANPTWWGRPEHNLDGAEFYVIKDPATRVAALLSGQIDLIVSTPPQSFERIRQTAGYRLLQTPELRTVFLGMDVGRGELLESNVKGRNPFQDIRVRHALTQAIDEDAIVSHIMRGFAVSNALVVGPGVSGFDPALNKRLPYDPTAAARLLAEAGYPDGFEVGFDCPNDRYVNDEQICEAVVIMLARIGVKARLLAQTRAKFFGKVGEPAFNTSLYLYSWSPPTYDAHNTLLNILATRDRQTGAGVFNNGGYSNPALDDLIAKIQVETDAPARQRLLAQALTIVRDDVPVIPLHQQTVVWAARDGVSVAQGGDNWFQLRYAQLK